MATALVLLGAGLWWVLGIRPQPPSEPPVPQPTEVPETQRPTVFKRAEPPASTSVPTPPPAPTYEPLALGDLPRDEQLATKNAASRALGAAIAACEPHTPSGLVVIAVVTVDESGLSELVALDGKARPLDLPDLEGCLERTLWEQDWPAVSGALQLGLQYTGPAD